MTPDMNDPTSFAGVIALVLFVVRELWNMLKERNKPRIDSANAADLEERVRASLEKSLLAENERLTKRIDALELERQNVEGELIAARKLIADLTERDKKREAAMIALQADFDRDTALRANIDRMLSIANQRIEALENERAELNDKLHARDAELAKLREELAKRDAIMLERDAVILDLQTQITALKRGQTSGGLMRK